jgi:spore coat polysaccharide biosynthesis protein SpsF
MKPVIAIIEGRTNSSRLPGKILMEINGKNSLELIFERLQKVPNLRDIILATTESAHDDKLTEEAKKLGFSVFRGDEQDVLGRIAAAAREHSNIDVLKLTADCPFVDPAIIMNVMDLYFASNSDFASNTIIRTFPDGMDCGIVRNSVLQEANIEALDPLEREHTSLFVRRNFHRYTLVNLDAPSDLAHPEIGLTLDTIEDLEFLTAIASHFDSNELFSCKQILELLSTKPHLKNINSIVHRRGDT